jgi:hypothetical protein|tara:strand:+ start:61689 stop:62036 length:348 start_codon:yes stop_codon:yes gene_type:complete
MDGIRGGLGYPGGRTGQMGNEMFSGNMSHGFGSLGYPGGRSGYMGMHENHAFGATEQVAQAPVNQASNNNSPLKAINSIAFGRGTTTNIPFFGAVPTVPLLGAICCGAAYLYMNR